MFRRLRIDTAKHAVGSLCWRGDELVDWASGGDSWTMAGEFKPAFRGWGYPRLDAATCDPTGRWAVVYERTGTAGIVLRDGEIVREIHRSPYHADAFEYPVCLFERAGRTLLAHCPDHYARIEIDDAGSGERLTRSDSRKEVDFFHSRLAVSPGGRRLLSAGWVWHPWDAVVWFDVEAALARPAMLDELKGAELSRNVCLTEESSACWLDDDRLLVGGSSEPEDADEAAEVDREHPGPRLRPNSLAVFDIRAMEYTTTVQLGRPPGVMMAAGPERALTLFKHPRLHSLLSGEVIHEWSDIDSGELVSSVVRNQRYPVFALDPLHARFAVAGQGFIEVIELEPSR